MATQQHLYRRGPIYWWRRVLELSPSVRCDIRLSLRTSVKAEAQHRAGYLTAMAGGGTMAVVLNDSAPTEPDRVMTASELTAIYKRGLDTALARFIYQQHLLPGEAVLNRQPNEASADYYQGLIDTGGTAAVMGADGRRIGGGLAASLERARGLPKGEVGVSNATKVKHLTWVKKVVEYAKRHGYGPAGSLVFSGFEKDRREDKVRARELRAKWTKK